MAPPNGNIYLDCMYSIYIYIQTYTSYIDIYFIYLVIYLIYTVIIYHKKGELLLRVVASTNLSNFFDLSSLPFDIQLELSIIDLQADRT